MREQIPINLFIAQWYIHEEIGRASLKPWLSAFHKNGYARWGNSRTEKS
jgi:hypothetical protein